MPVQFLDGTTEFDGFAPRENIRIKMNGGGLNYVHGGTSLQELVVPVIDYRFLRNDYKTYQKNKAKIDTKPVTVSLLSANRKIVNMIFSLNFYQKEAVSDNREAATIFCTRRCSEEHQRTSKIIAEKRATTHRGAHSVQLHAKPLKYPQDSTISQCQTKSGCKCR